MTEPLTDEALDGFRELANEVERLKAELDDSMEAVGLAQWALKYAASSLYATGFNERHAMECPNQTDEAGITASEWRAHYKKAMADVSKARDKAKAVLNRHHGLPAASDQ